MRILAIDSSAGPASCSVTENGRVLACSSMNRKMTHSQTLMPMLDDMLRNAALSLSEIDLLAVSAGPGSFTGVRIGVSAVKGMAFAENKPCVPVSTLAAIARNADGCPFEGIVCSVMDARCGQVYTACFRLSAGRLTRLTSDEAISIAELGERLCAYQEPVWLMGDGSALCYAALRDIVPKLWLAPEALRYQSATGVAAEAARMAADGETVTADRLMPMYLRLPQAERERLARG